MSLLQQTIMAVMAPLADPAAAVTMRRYMKDQFAFLGIKTPQRRAALSPLLPALSALAPGEVLTEARLLWALPEREYHYCALDLLARSWKQLSLDDIDALLGLARDKSWWDTVDALASIIGDVLHAGRAQDAHCQRRMDSALGDGDLWIRRVAMLHQLGWRGDTDTQRLFAYALALGGEQEFFIRKAIGWALRDYARHDPGAVTNFLLTNNTRLSALTRREAARHLPI